MGAAAYRRGSRNISRQIDRELEENARITVRREEIERLSDERRAAQEQAADLSAQLMALRAELAQAQAENAAHITKLTEERDIAQEDAERLPAHYKFLWQEERAAYLRAVLRYQQLKTIVLCGLSEKFFTIAKTEAQIYFPHVNWTGVETMEYPRPPLFGYQEPVDRIAYEQLMHEVAA